jgi:hypothetical protein
MNGMPVNMAVPNAVFGAKHAYRIDGETLTIEAIEATSRMPTMLHRCLAYSRSPPQIEALGSSLLTEPKELANAMM